MTRPSEQPEVFVPKGWTRKLLCVEEGIPEPEVRDLFRRILRRVGYGPLDVAFVPSVRAKLKHGEGVTMKRIRADRPKLVNALAKLPAERVVAFGAVAFKALMDSGKVKITEGRGRKHKTPEGVVFELTYHPGTVLNGAGHFLGHILSDLKPKTPLPEVVEAMPKLDKVAIDAEWDAEGKWLLGAVSDGVGTIPGVAPDGLKLLPGQVVVGHNVWPDIEIFTREGADFPVTVFEGRDTRDTIYLAKLGNENLESYKLENVVSRYFDVGEGWKKNTEAELKETGDAALLDQEELLRRCMWDAHSTWHLANYIEPKLSRPELVDYIHRLAATLRRVGLAGIPIHVPTFESLAVGWQAKQQAAEVALRSHGFEGTLTNDNDVRKFLFDTLGLKPVAYTEKNREAKVDRQSMKTLRETAVAEIADILDLMMEYSKYEKLVSTWGPVSDNIVDRRGDLGLFHAWINPFGARTGRRSSGKTEENLNARNAQNWPKEARKAFHNLLSADFDRLEPVLMAHHSGDPRMMEMFTTPGVNGYIEVAKLLFNTNVEEGTQLYKATKIVVLGISYDMGPPRLAIQLWNAGVRFSSDYEEHYEKTVAVHGRYMHLFSGVADFIEERKREVRKTQRVVARDGWVRHLPHDEKRRWRAENQAVNFPIQHAASVVTGSAMIMYEQEQLRLHGWTAKDLHLALMENPWGDEIPFGVICNEIHDELVLRPKTEQDVEVLLSCMRNPTLAKSLLKLPKLHLEAKTARSESFGS